MILGFLALEEVGRSKSKVRSKGMNIHGSSHIDSLELSDTDSFIEAVEDYLERGEAPEL